MFTHLDLFAGIGGFSRAVHWLGGTTVGFVEWDAWNRRVLAKHWPEAHFHGDIRTFTGATLREWGIRARDSMADADPCLEQLSAEQTERDGSPGRPRLGHNLSGTGRNERRSDTQVDLITGGYPCQPFSLAGQRLGAEDDRHLWPEMRRVVNLVRPRWVLAENVAGHITMGLDTVLADLEADGYTCGAIVVPACAVNALHRRDRVWIMAHATCERDERGGESWGRWPELADGGSGMAHTGSGEGEPRHGPDLLGGWSDEAEQAGLGGSGTSMADAPARGLRRGGAPGEPGQPAQRGEGTPHPDSQGEPTFTGDVRSGCGKLGSRPAGVSSRRQAARALDAGADGLRAGLVRRPAAGPDRPDLIRQAWADGSWEIGLPRVVADEPERRQKLQAAGNAIVPLVAYEILRVMIGADDD